MMEVIKELSEIIRFAIGVSVPLGVMGMSAYLMYHQVPGWGWFLMVSAAVVLSARVHVD